MRLFDYPASANCYKVRLALAQLECAYERVGIDIFAGATLTDEFARLNPARSTPVLMLDDGRALVESGAILYYLATDTPLMPDSRIARAEVIRWLIFEQTDVMPSIGGLRFRVQTGRWVATDPPAMERRQMALEVLGLLDAHLTENKFFAGDQYSIADIAIYGYTHVAHETGIDMAYDAIDHWLDAVRRQPGHLSDLAPYPPNAAPGAGRSIYD